VVEGFREGEPTERVQQNWQEELVSLLQDPQLAVKQATDKIVRRHHLPRRLVYRKAVEIRSAHNSAPASED